MRELLVFLSLSPTGGEDFDADPITLSFTANDSTAVASIPILNDAIVEDTETFQFLTVAGNSVLDIDVSQAQGSLTILDNEGAYTHQSCTCTLLDLYLALCLLALPKSLKSCDLVICLYEVLQVSYHTVCSHLRILAVHHFDSTMLTVAANESDGAAIVTVRRRRYLQRESTVIIQPVTGTAEGNRILMV